MRFEREGLGIGPLQEVWRASFSSGAALSLLLGAALTLACVSPAQNETPLATASATIVLPPRLMAGHPATLAVLGADGKLAAGVKVDLGNGQTVTTDRTGRALFNAPATGDYVLAKGAGASAAALVDPAVGASEPRGTTLPPIVSMHDRFWICGAELSGEADANTVKIDGQPALVMAASPICLVALAGPDAKPGPASLSIEAPGVKWSATTLLVSLEFETPTPPLKPGQMGQLKVRAEGTNRKLQIIVRNETPNVLKFVRGDVQELFTSGGSLNSAPIRVEAIASGNFSFTARVLPAPDTASAERFLRAAKAQAPQELQRKITDWSRRLARHPRDAEKVRRELDRIARNTLSDECRTLLDAARAAL